MKNASSILLVLVVLAMGWPEIGEASLTHYIEKYGTVHLSEAQRERVSAYDELIAYFSSIRYFPAGRKVHPDFIRALILAESNADPEAVSSKQAHGLTQILYTTGKEAVESMVDQQVNLHDIEYVNFSQLRDLKPEDLHDPAVNILLACYLISKYNFDYNGRLDLVVSAWNAGAGSIQYDSPPDYEETLDLIGKVNGYFNFFLASQTPMKQSLLIIQQ